MKPTRTSAAMRALAAAFLAAGVARAALVSHQPLDDTAGLTLNNGASITTGGQGKFGEALLLDGIDDYAQVDAGSGITGGVQRTVSAWVFQTTGSSNLRTPVALGANGLGTKWDLDLDNTNGGIEVGVGGGRNAGSGLSGLSGQWILATSTLPVTGGTVAQVVTYLNGQATSAGTGTRVVATSSAAFYLGISANLNIQYLDGRVDDVAIWDEALSADEIKGLHDVGSSGELLYTAAGFDQLKQVHDAATGSVTLGSVQWSYATGLSGAAGLSGGGGNFTLVLDAAAGTGLTGIGTAPVEIAITSIRAVGGGLWELTLSGSPGVTCEFRSSATLDFNPGTRVDNLSQADPGDPGTISGPNDSQLTTDGSGAAIVRMPLTGAASDFVIARTLP